MPTSSSRLRPRTGRALDLVVAAVALVPAAPVMLATALLVRLTLGAPVLFAQRRAGRGGRVFTIRKFRTMTDARDAAGRLLPDARRTPPAGRLLRRTRLDELPQLLNLLAGDMSLIGPRPLLPETVAGFGAAGVARGAVRPGLTGWAQVHGNTALSERDKLALDLWYIRHRTRRRDALVLLRTARTILLGERIDPRRIAEAHASSALPGEGNG